MVMVTVVVTVSVTVAVEGQASTWAEVEGDGLREKRIRRKVQWTRTSVDKLRASVLQETPDAGWMIHPVSVRSSVWQGRRAADREIRVRVR